LAETTGQKSCDDRPQLTHRDFVDYELIHFSNYDLERSLPSAIDGLKVSQRKIIFGCFKRKLTSEIRVAQLADTFRRPSLPPRRSQFRERSSDWLRTTLVPTTSIFSDRTGTGTRIQGGRTVRRPGTSIPNYQLPL
jgi:hypothetical protein